MNFLKALLAKLVCAHDWDVVVSIPLKPYIPHDFIENKGGWGMQGAEININVPLEGHIVVLSCSKCGRIYCVPT